MKYTNNEIDSMVLLAIGKISTHEDAKFKARPMTIASFLKGTSHSPFRKYYNQFPSICGSMALSVKQVQSSCKRLLKCNKIKKISENGSYSFELISEPLFLEMCTREEKLYVDDITKHIKNKFPDAICDNKTNRYCYSLPSYNDKTSDVVYSWFWFSRYEGHLIFKYKMRQCDADRTLYDQNIIYASDLQKETIKNIITLLTNTK